MVQSSINTIKATVVSCYFLAYDALLSSLLSISSHLFAEFDALTGSKIASIDLGARVVRMAYSPTASHIVIAILEVGLNISLYENTKHFLSPSTEILALVLPMLGVESL